MSTYERGVTVTAPFEDVWTFHSTTDGLQALTPSWMNLRIEEIRGPDGERNPEIMESGATAKASVRPMGLGPRMEMTTTIVERERNGDAGSFVDEMAGGPFAEWRHTHRFRAVGEQTHIHDHVESRLAGGAAGRLADRFAVLGLDPMFRYRHRRTKALLG